MAIDVNPNGLFDEFATEFALSRKRLLESAAMRRALAVFMLFLLPLQFSWAVAATYCPHETAPEAQHFGHHDHRHAAQAVSDSSPDAQWPGAVDNDCNACHAGCVVAILNAAATPSIVAAISVVADSPSAPPATVHLARPERPNWRLLA